jgi:hypothetical protein
LQWKLKAFRTYRLDYYNTPLDPSRISVPSPHVSRPPISHTGQTTAANMSTLEDLDALEHQDKKEGEDQDPKKPNQSGDADMKDADGDKKDDEEEEEQLDADILNSSTRDIVTRRRLLENDTRIMRSEFQRLTHEKQAMLEKIKDNVDKIDNNRCAAPTACQTPMTLLTCPIQPTAIPRRQRCRDSRSGRRRRCRRRRCQRRPGCHARRQVGRHQDVDPSNHLPAPHWSRRPREAQAW